MLRAHLCGRLDAMRPLTLGGSDAPDLICPAAAVN
jgi:hypothetical protein